MEFMDPSPEPLEGISSRHATSYVGPPAQLQLTCIVSACRATPEAPRAKRIHRVTLMEGPSWGWKCGCGFKFAGAEVDLHRVSSFAEAAANAAPCGAKGCWPPPVRNGGAGSEGSRRRALPQPGDPGGA